MRPRVCECVWVFIYQCTVSCVPYQGRKTARERQAERVRTTAVRTQRDLKPRLQAHYHRDRVDRAPCPNGIIINIIMQ